MIESRVTERGGITRQETVIDAAEKFARIRRLQELKSNFQKTEIGVQASLSSYEEFSLELENTIPLLKDKGVNLLVRRSNEYRILSGIAPINLVAEYRVFYGNVLDGAFFISEFL